MAQPIGTLTPFQRLAIIKRTTGLNITTSAYEYCIGVRTADNAIAATFVGVVVEWRARAHRITHTTLKMRAWAVSGGVWAEREPIVVRDPLDVPRILIDGNVIGMADRAEKIEWERLAYRCGTAKWPVDSHARQNQGYR